MTVGYLLLRFYCLLVVCFLSVIWILYSIFTYQLYY